MPGYGYAAVAKSKSESWGELARDYLRGPTVARARVRARRLPAWPQRERSRDDAGGLDAAAISYAVVLTKGETEVKGG